MREQLSRQSRSGSRVDLGQSDLAEDEEAERPARRLAGARHEGARGEEERGEEPDARAAQKVLHLGRIITSQAPVLKKGDSLTLDWQPNAGMSMGYNQNVTPLPGHDVGFYNTLLAIWLGDKASDPTLRSHLLGRPSASRASAD